MTEKYYDCIIVGAGISGIGAGYHLQKYCPTETFAILENRAALGGTWDFFNYPGLRSDSDMLTFGYSFYHWNRSETLAGKKNILGYLNEVVTKFDLKKRIQFNTNVSTASWNTSEAKWTITTSKGDVIKCKFLFMCGGYYSYDKGYNPEFPGKDSFQGRILHPQNWDTSVDMKGKRVIVIGSGATAITLIPELVKMGAKHVTMVQRSPTFILDVPGQDWLVAFLRLTLPTKVATTVGRWGSIAIQVLMYKFCRLFPTLARWVINFNVKWHLGSQVDMKHFTPKYNPWDQRLCLCPDADFFKAVRSGSADIVTGPVDTFNESGLRVGGLANVQIDADVIVTATGMNLQSNFPMSSVKTTIDGKEYHPPNHMLYRTLMLSNIPNFAFSFGYINASWTLKADLISRYVCKLLNHMRSDNYKIVTPVVPKDVKALTALPLNSGYMNRSKGNLPSVGDRGPWVARHNFITDRYNMEYSNLEEGLVFKK